MFKYTITSCKVTNFFSNMKLFGAKSASLGGLNLSIYAAR